MFSMSLKRVYRLCDRVFTRNVRRGRLGSIGSKSGPNPGMDQRLAAFEKEGFKIKSDNAEEYLEKSESNFYGVGDEYGVHEKVNTRDRESLRHNIIKEKYFKENLPNLLTWSEKEQIRHLCNHNPEEWTPETIAESFPVTPAVVRKLLKYPWKPASLDRITRHDNSALRNWRELKDGSLNIPQDLREHFLKFSDRTIPPLQEKSLKIEITPSRNMGEFERIINRCADKEERINTQSYNEIESGTDSREDEAKRTPQKKDSKKTTLDELALKIKHRLRSGEKINENDQLMADSVKKDLYERGNFQAEIILEETAKPSALSGYKEEEKEVVLKSYPERIRVPKSAYKRGATYKVDDCYYDSDGRFLYRVLGMTKNE